jgi:predicted PurR-regulated permease PerM
MDYTRPQGAVDEAPADRSPTVRTAGIVVLATLAVTAALYVGHELFVPIVFALLLTAVFRPLVRRLQRAHVPPAATAAIVGIGLLLLVTAAGFAVAAPLKKALAELPEHFNAAEEKLQRFRAPVQQVKDAAKRMEHVAQGPSTLPTVAVEPPAPQGSSLLVRVFGSTAKVLSGAVETLLLLVLVLASGDLFPRKIVKVMPTPFARDAAAKVLAESESVVLRYLLVTLLINLVQGTVVGLVLAWLGMPQPFVWGMATVALEFVPYLGATVMVALLTISAFAAFDSLGRVLAVPGSYLVITTIQNNLVSPLAYGNRLKLNPVAVLVAVLFWWFVWGTAGAFVAVPIVATVKVIADHAPRLSALAELLGE